MLENEKLNAEKAANNLNQHLSPPLGDGGMDGGFTFYGLPYCDSTKLAMEWFNERHIAFALHDYKTQGVTGETLQSWCGQKGWQTLLNKRSTTWRALTAETQAAITNEASAIAIMVQHTSLIKRPVIVKDGGVLSIGVNKLAWANIFEQ